MKFITGCNGKSSFSKTLFTSKLDLDLRNKLLKCCIWSIALYGVETWTLQKVGEKYPEGVETWCWRRLEKVRWADHVRHEVLQKVKEKRIIIQTIQEGTLIGSVMCYAGSAF